VRLWAVRLAVAIALVGLGGLGSCTSSRSGLSARPTSTSHLPGGAAITMPVSAAHGICDRRFHGAQVGALATTVAVMRQVVNGGPGPRPPGAVTTAERALTGLSNGDAAAWCWTKEHGTVFRYGLGPQGQQALRIETTASDVGTVELISG